MTVTVAGQRFYRGMFLVGGLWNVLGGITLIAIARSVFSAAQLPFPDPAVYFYAWIALFMTFGIGYFMVALDMYGNINIIWLGIIGKLAFVAVFAAQMMLGPGEIPQAFLIPIIGDLVFVVLFVMFLLHRRAQPVSTRPP
jgi:hypothetical protein